MLIGIHGPGRLGRSLAELLPRAGHRIRLTSRDQSPTGDVVLLTVPDRQIAAAAASMPPGPIVLHCSGASDVEILRPHRPAGSLHPLMTFPGPEISLPSLHGVPAAIAGDSEARTIARSLAEDLGMTPVEIPGDRRLYHAAAVMAGNFSTVLLAEASRVLSAAGIPREEAPSLLLPLALQSLTNARHDPVAALTGPAVRGDQDVLEAHRRALEAAGLLDSRVLYDLLSERAATLSSTSTDENLPKPAPDNKR